MSGEWPLRRLTDVVSLPKGQVSPLEAPYKSQILLAPDHMESGTGEIRKRETAESQGAVSGKYVVRPGDVVFSKIRPALRKVALADFTGICSADMYPLRPGAEVIGGFVKAVLLGEEFSRYAESLSGRTGIPKINRGDLAGFWFPVPPIEEQQRIIEVIGSVTELERGIEASIAKLRNFRQGILDDAFRRCGRRDGGSPYPESAIGDLCSVASGSTPPRSAGTRYFSDSGVPWVKTLDLNEGPILHTDESLSQAAVSELSVRVFPAGSVLLAMYGGWEQIGRTSILRTPAAVNQAISVLLPNGDLDADYLLTALQHGRHRWRQFAASTRKDPNITKADVQKFRIQVPSREEQARIVELGDTFLREIGNQEAELSKLRDLKRGLVRDLLSGKGAAPLAGI